MTDHMKIVNNLRTAANVSVAFGTLMTDAAAAIEDLNAELSERIELTTKQQGVLLDRIEELEQQIPKRAEWRPIQIGRWRGFECTNCKICQEVPTGNGGKPQWKYCHECGSNMGVQDG